MPTIELENVTKVYKRKKRSRGEKKFEVAVEQVNLTIHQGEFVFIVGSSGAGKSTLLSLLAGQTRPSRGKVYVGGKDLAWMMKFSRNRASVMFGKVWQEPTLIRNRTVEENLILAARISYPREGADKIQPKVKKVLGLVGLSGFEKKYPVEMSIGEARRIELARALIGSPPILLLDEITANLDDDSIWDIFHLLVELNRRGTTVIMVTHASQYVNILRRRVITLVDGKIYGDVKKGRYGDVAEKKTTVLTAYGTDLI